MKLTFRDIEPFVQKPNPQARVILIYGPDNGLITERSKIICKSVIEDLNDPFNVAIFTSDKILDDPAAFYDEANAQSLMGGNRLILVKNGSDSISLILKEYLENPSLSTLVVIESDNLGTKSSLRALCEKSASAAALPCYIDDEKDITRIIREMTKQAGFTIDQDALMALSSGIVGDRIIARNEIEKLILYKGPLKAANNTITIHDIVASYGDVRDWSMDSLIYALAEGRIKEVQSILTALFKDQIAPIAIIRSTQNHFWRLLDVHTRLMENTPLDEALKKLNPPLFWKFTDSFKRQINLWKPKSIENILDNLHNLEIKCKKTEYNDIAMVENSFLQIARFINSNTR